LCINIVKMKATATHTYYFETWNEESVLRDVLQRYSCDKLRYYKYVGIWGKLLVFYNLHGGRLLCILLPECSCCGIASICSFLSRSCESMARLKYPVFGTLVRVSFLTFLKQLPLNSYNLEPFRDITTRISHSLSAKR
jgi:hypothetical protein